MPFDERSYSGKLSRPAPMVHVEDDGSFGVIATPWGNRQAAKKVIDILTDYVLSSRQDMEATSPFQRLSCLSPLANNLRAGVMLANDLLYREDNKAEHAVGVEVLVFAQSQNELAFAQVGAPQFFLAREGMPWIPVGVQLDLSAEFSRAPENLAPLPQNLLGLHNTTNMIISSFKTQAADRLIFLSHSIVSHPLFTMSRNEADLGSISQKLSKQYPELPFWLGMYTLKS